MTHKTSTEPDTRDQVKKVGRFNCPSNCPLIKLYEELVKTREEKEKYEKERIEWYDNYDLSKVIKVSARTLQHMRLQGILPYSKVGSKVYYKASDVEKLFRDNYICNHYSIERKKHHFE